ncbi:MAG: Wzz/FepE/Etk N-terminal domain-containing protein, partial [Thermodesulfobacteriota bacterium]
MINSASHRGKSPHIKDYIDVLSRRLWVLIVVFVVLVSTVAIATLRMTPIYMATTTVQVEEEAGKTTNPLLGELAKLAAPSKILTEIEIVKSRSIAEKVVRDLELQKQITFRPTRSLLKEVIGSIKSRIRKPPVKNVLVAKRDPSRSQKGFDFQYMEVADYLKGFPFFIEFTDDGGNFHVLDRDKASIGVGRIGEPFEKKGL